MVNSQTYHLTSDVAPTSLLTDKGVLTWEEAIRFVQRLPYGRTKSRSDFNSVIVENQGTCSSKHALLKIIADQNNIPNVNLILAIYKMNRRNTPGIGGALTTAGLQYLPEAHCYLQLNEKAVDITFMDSDIRRISDDIMTKQEIIPSQTDTYKVEFHKNYMRQWLLSEKINLSFDQIWEIREQCIRNLSQK